VRPTAPSVAREQHQGPPKKILEREFVDAHHEARKIRDEAEQKAQEIVDRAEADAEETRQRGYQEGYQEGAGQYTEQVTRALLELKKKEQALEGEFVKLVRLCVEKVLSQELKLHPDAVAGLVRNALHDARQQREIIVRIHPDDVEQLKKNKARLLEMLARASDIEIRGDNAVARGGCMVMTELGTIDASLERQLKAIEDAIDEEMREGSPGDHGDGYDANEGELDPEDDPGYGNNY
jgi:type III secretion protein L